MKRVIIPFLVAIILCGGCDKNTEIEDPKPKPNVEDGAYDILGAIQKGPFVQGSSITISELDADLNPTGVNFKTTTKDHTGAFEIGSKINSRYVEVEASGYYFDEVSGKISSSELTLRTISDLESSTRVNVNLLTSLARERMKTLIKTADDNTSFEQIQIQAENDVLTAFGLKKSDARFDKMDITKQGNANAMLLAVSVTLQSERSVGEMSELVAQFGDEIAQSGEITSSAIKELVRTGAVGIDLEKVSQNLTDRYSTLGVECDVPDFDNYVDSDGNGTIDSYEAWLLVDGEQSYNIDYKQQAVKVNIEQNIKYDIDIEYSPALSSGEQGWINYSVEQTRSAIVNECVTFTADKHTGTDTRSAIITFKSSENAELSSEIKIIQTPDGALVLGEDISPVSALGDIITVQFATNIPEYIIEIPIADQSWIKPVIAPKGRASMQNYSEQFTILENPLTTERTSKLRVTAGDKVDYITITQYGHPKLSFSTNRIRRPYKTEDVEFIVYHNSDYTIDWDDTNPCWGLRDNRYEVWKHELVSEEEGQDTYRISMRWQGKLLGEPAGYYYKATISIRSEEGGQIISDYLTLSQEPRSCVTLDQHYYNQTFNSKQQQTTITLTTNLDLVPSTTESWITINENTVPRFDYSTLNTTLTYTFDIEQNSDKDVRSADIHFTTPAGTRCHTVSISQLGEGTTLTVDNLTMGDLQNRLSSESADAITELIITGEMNTDDLNYTKQLANLQTLDMRNVTFDGNIIDGANWLDYNSRETPIITAIYFPTERHIGRNLTIQSLQTLKVLDFGGIYKLEDQQISELSSLEELNIKNIEDYGNNGINLSYTQLERLEFGPIEVVGYNISCSENTKLKEVIFNDATLKITTDFYGCSSIETIKLPANLQGIGEDDPGSYSSPFMGTAIKSIDIPETVEWIGSGAFMNCTSLKEVNFLGTPSIRSIYGRSTADNISGRFSSYGAFQGCTSLESITIPASVKSIIGGVFAYSGLKSITFAPDSRLTKLVGSSSTAYGGFTGGGGTSGYVGVFTGTHITNISLPRSLREIGAYALSGVVFEDLTLEYIEVATSLAFKNSEIRGTLSLPSLYTVENHVFANSNIGTLYMPRVEELGEYAFINSNITTFDGEKIYKIGEGAFGNCANLKSINLPNLETAAQYAFKGCTSLQNISLPRLILSVMDGGAFENCTSLETISIPNANELANEVFANCYRLTTIEAPNITRINGEPFINCSSLTTDAIKPIIENVESITFDDGEFFGYKDIEAGRICGYYFPELTNDQFPKLTEISGTICSMALTKIDLPLVVGTSWGSEIDICDSPMLTSVRLENYTGDIEIYDCELLKELYIPMVDSQVDVRLGNLPSLTELDVTNLSNDFRIKECASIKIINLPNYKGNWGITIEDCSSLEELYIPKYEYLLTTELQDLRVSKLTYATDVTGKLTISGGGLGEHRNMFGRYTDQMEITIGDSENMPDGLVIDEIANTITLYNDDSTSNYSWKFKDVILP